MKRQGIVVSPDKELELGQGVTNILIGATSGGISLTSGYKGSDSGPGAIGVGVDAAVEVGIGLPSLERGIR